MDEQERAQRLAITRRSFLGRTATGIGSLALASLLDQALLFRIMTEEEAAPLYDELNEIIAMLTGLIRA